ncbi:MAG: ABC transporter permease [Candidatus Eisenbacteria bacterium]|nr:ABC transporter permease [Candidatus Eisenbacteria bacterium]
MNGTLAITYLTMHEALRRRVLLVATVLALGFLAIFATGFYFINVEARPGGGVPGQRVITLAFLVMAGLYAVNFLVVMMAALMPVDTLSGEIRSGAIQSLVTKPVRRAEVVLGKWLGFWLILMGYLALTAGGVLLVAWLISGYLPPNVALGLPLMALEGTFLLTLSIAGGTRLSTLTNGVMVFGLYGLAFIGGWVEQVGALFGNATASNVGIFTSLLVPSEALWHLAAYHMQPALMRDLALTPFSPAAVPSGAMVVWAAGYTLAALLLALWQFNRRDL